MNGKWYYRGRNGLEYATLEDANRYGGGVNGKRFYNPVKVWEPVYEEVSNSTSSNSIANPKVSELVQKPEMLAGDTMYRKPLIDMPQALNEYDSMDVVQLKEMLRVKGYAIRGNPKRETIIAKLKSL